MAFPLASVGWLKSWKIWVVFSIYGVLLGLFILLFPLFVLFNIPSPYRPVVIMLLDETCGGRPRNTELPGIASNLAITPPAWRIAIFNGQCKHRLFVGLGGDDFHEAACSPEFSHRINARDAEQASQFLRELLAQRPASVEDVEIIVLDHGSPGAPRFASRVIPSDFYQSIKESSPQRTTLRFYGCAVGQGEDGKTFMNRLASQYGFRVVASVKRVAWNTFRWSKSQVAEVPEEDWVTVEPI